MPDLQSCEIDAKTLYVLDLCCEDDTIDSGASVALRLYGNRPIIRDIIANTPVCVRDPYPWRQNISSRLTDYADGLIADLPRARRGELGAVAMIHLHHVRCSTATYQASAAISDMVEGGWCKSYNRPPRAKDRLTPYGKDWRRLTAPGWIRRYVKRDDESARLRRFASRVLVRLADLPLDMIRGDISSFQTEFDAVRQRSRAREATFRVGMAAGLSFEEAADLSEGRSSKRLLVLARKAKAALRERRKVIKRAAGLAQAVVGREALAGFASGTGALIMGETAGFYVRPALSLTTVGHGALDIDVLSPEREVLGKLCFFINGTPAIDQLTAIGLHCAAGAEQDIIDIANVVSVTVSGAGHPLLMRKEKPSPTVRIFDAATGIEHTVTPEEQINWRNDDYVAKTGHIWRECLGIHMMGHRHLKLMEGLVAQ